MQLPTFSAYAHTEDATLSQSIHNDRRSNCGEIFLHQISLRNLGVKIHNSLRRSELDCLSPVVPLLVLDPLSISVHISISTFFPAWSTYVDNALFGVSIRAWLRILGLLPPASAADVRLAYGPPGWSQVQRAGLSPYVSSEEISNILTPTDTMHMHQFLEDPLRDQTGIRLI